VIIVKRKVRSARGTRLKSSGNIQLGSVTVSCFDSHQAGVAIPVPLPLRELPAEGTVAVGGKLFVAKLMDRVHVSRDC